MWETDGQTDRQTEFSSLYRVCITCSAVKTYQNTQTDTNESLHSEMDPVWQNPTQRTAHLSVFMTVQNFSTQYNTEQWWQSTLLPPVKRYSSEVVYQTWRGVWYAGHYSIMPLWIQYLRAEPVTQAWIRLELQVIVESTDHLWRHSTKLVTNQMISITVTLQYWNQLVWLHHLQSNNRPSKIDRQIFIKDN